MAGLPPFEVESAAASAAATAASGLAVAEPTVDSVTTLSVLLMSECTQIKLSAGCAGQAARRHCLQGI